MSLSAAWKSWFFTATKIVGYTFWRNIVSEAAISVQFRTMNWFRLQNPKKDRSSKTFRCCCSSLQLLMRASSKIRASGLMMYPRYISLSVKKQHLFKFGKTPALRRADSLLSTSFKWASHWQSIWGTSASWIRWVWCPADLEKWQVS